MPEYLAPGVFVEEVSFRHKSIEGVGTSVAALVGPTRSGPLRGVPEVCTSYADYERVFGDADDLRLGGTAVLNHSAHAARAFFDNGGKQLYVVRVAAGGNAVGANGDGASALRAQAGDAASLQFRARFPGHAGDLTLELRWRDSESLLQQHSLLPGAAQPDTTYLLVANGVGDAAAAGPAAPAVFPVDAVALVRRNGASLEVQAARARFTSRADPANPAPLAADQITGFTIADLPAGARLLRLTLKPPASGALGAGSSVELRLRAEADLSVFTGSPHWGDLRVLRGTLDAGGDTLTLPVSARLNPGIAAPVTLPLAALAAVPDAVEALMVQRRFDIDVRRGGRDGEVIYRYADLDTRRELLLERMPAQPERALERLGSPIEARPAVGVDGAALLAAIAAMADGAALNPGPGSVDGPRWLVTLGGGSDGGVPGAGDYAGEVNEALGNTGLAALEDVEDVSIVMTPAAAAHAGSHDAVVLELQKHCRRMKYRIGLVDSRLGMAVSEVRNFASGFSDSRLALYHPWVRAADPTGARPELVLPPAGFVAGICARTDVDRGVHKAPANEVVFGALGFEQEINAFQQELLNPNGINCLRSFPGRGHRVWGGRTLSGDPEWKYLNVRRYFLYLERSIDKSTQWAVFEPNGEALWANVRSAVEDFLFAEWRGGRLLGGTPKAAYFVRCDRTTMTQNDIDNGRLVCLVGVAPLRPAEFVIFRIGQKTADA